MTNGDVELIDENNIHKLLIRPLKGFFCEGGGGCSLGCYGNMCLRESKNTEFVWEIKRGFKLGGRK